MDVGKRILMNKPIGKVFLIGAGPGDPGLLTLRAVGILKRADVVFYDHLVHPQILEFCPRAEKHYVGKIGYGDHVAQEEIQEKLFQAARHHPIVVRLKGGDPFIFGRGGEEAECLWEQGVDFEIVPGVSSAIAVPAYAGIPLTHRSLGSSVTIVTGHEGKEKDEALPWSEWALSETLVLLMGVHRLQENFESLIRVGKKPDTPAALIEWGTYPRQRTWVGTLQTLPDQVRAAGATPPAIAVVGEVVRLRERLQWFEKKPLLGKRILITRARPQIPELRDPLAELGAELLELPTIEVQALAEAPLLQSTLQSLEKFSWILFSSVNGVDFFFRNLREHGVDFRRLHHAKIAAIGPSTRARLELLGLRVDKQPEEFTSEAMAKSLSTEEIRGREILFPRAAVARDEPAEDLIGRGAKLTVLPIYQAVCPRYSPDALRILFEERPPELLTFASSSTVKNFSQILQSTPYWKQALQIPAIVIGPVTLETAKHLGLNVVGMPKEYTVSGMVGKILEYFG
jgi:uroporphyrinogen III methyltransferase/synthase